MVLSLPETPIAQEEASLVLPFEKCWAFITSYTARNRSSLSIVSGSIPKRLASRRSKVGEKSEEMQSQFVEWSICAQSDLTSFPSMRLNNAFIPRRNVSVKNCFLEIKPSNLKVFLIEGRSIESL